MAKSPRSATFLCENVPRLEPISSLVLELLAGLHHLDGLLLAEGQRHAVGAGVLRAEDELAEVGGAARHRDVVGEGGLALVDVGEEALQRGRGGEVDPDEADLLGVRRR